MRRLFFPTHATLAMLCGTLLLLGVTSFWMAAPIWPAIRALSGAFFLYVIWHCSRRGRNAR